MYNYFFIAHIYDDADEKFAEPVVIPLSKEDGKALLSFEGPGYKQAFDKMVDIITREYAPNNHGWLFDGWEVATDEELVLKWLAY